MTTTILLTVGSIFTALALLGMGAAGLTVYLRRSQAATVAPGLVSESRLAVLEGKLAAVEVTVKGLPSLWEEERRRAKHSQDAARKDRASAEALREQVEEVLEAVDDVPDEHAAGGGGAGLQPMQPGVGDAAQSSLHERAASIAHLMR